MKKILFILLLATTFLNAQQLAFPTAFGAGAYTEGGRGGSVIHVTNLNDSGVGSLRWALTDASNRGLKRTIVFDVSGLIELNSNIQLSGDDPTYIDGITIAGQTAPQGGITVTGGKIRIVDINQVVVRYLKFRETTLSDGCLTSQNGSSVIFDHLSGSNTPDIVFSIVESVDASRPLTTNKTIQNCLMAQSKNGLIIGDSSPESFVPDAEISVLRNAYYNIGWRAPFKGGSAVKVDAINNVIHNWSDRLIRMDAYDYELNHISNYYQAGASTANQLLWCSYIGTANPKIYNEDNFLEDDPRGSYVKPAGYDADESVAWTEFLNNFNPLPSGFFVNTANPIRGEAMTILPSSEVKASVLPLVGASQYIKDDGTVGFYRDIYDTEHVNGIDTNNAVGRVTAIPLPIQTLSNTRPENFYASNPHIPEAYLVTRGITGNSTVHNTVMPSGYTLLEEYLNQVDAIETPPVSTAITNKRKLLLISN